MITATMEEVQTSLPEILAKLAPGESAVIYCDGKPVGTISADLPKGVPIYGRGKGTVTYMAPDFDAPLEDFKEYGK